MFYQIDQEISKLSIAEQLEIIERILHRLRKEKIMHNFLTNKNTKHLRIKQLIKNPLKVDLLIILKRDTIYER